MNVLGFADGSTVIAETLKAENIPPAGDRGEVRELRSIGGRGERLPLRTEGIVCQEGQGMLQSRELTNRGPCLTWT